jgi:hypothetical protein
VGVAADRDPDGLVSRVWGSFPLGVLRVCAAQGGGALDYWAYF